MIKLFIKEHLHEIVDVIIDQIEKSLNDFKEHEKIIT